MAMILLLWILIFAGALTALIIAANLFTDSAEKLGLYFGMPPFMIGAVILSLGTSLPELANSILGVVKGVPDIIVGNVLGANITNILLVLGVCAIVAGKLKITKEVMQVDLPLLIGSALWVVFVAFDGKFVLWEAILTIIFLVVFLRYAVSGKVKEYGKKVWKKKVHPKITAKTIVTLVVSGILIYFGAKFTIEALLEISKGVGIAEGIIAATVLAIGTTLPELIVGVQAARKKKYELAVGTVLGSNIINVLLVLGIPGLIATITFSHTMIFIALPFMVGATLLFLFTTQSKLVTKHEGWMLVLMYVLYVGTMFVMG
ncbi:MAG: calcium/sodium antiporter [archaeon]